MSLISSIIILHSYQRYFFSVSQLLVHSKYLLCWATWYYLCPRKCLISLFQFLVELFFHCQIFLMLIFFARLHFFNLFIWAYLFPMYILAEFSAYICLIYVLCQSNSYIFFCFRSSMKQLSSDTGVEMNLTVEVFLFSQCLEWPITRNQPDYYK